MNTSQIKSEQKRFLNQIKDRIDNSINTILGVVWQLRKDGDILTYSEPDFLSKKPDGTQNHNYYFTITHIEQTLYEHLDPFQSAGCRIAVTKKGDDRVISSYNGDSAESYFEELGFTKENITEYYDYIDGKKDRGFVPGYYLIT